MDLVTCLSNEKVTESVTNWVKSLGKWPREILTGNLTPRGQRWRKMGSSPSAHSPKLPMVLLRLASAPPADGTDSGQPLPELKSCHLEAEGDDGRMGPASLQITCSLRNSCYLTYSGPSEGQSRKHSKALEKAKEIPVYPFRRGLGIR